MDQLNLQHKHWPKCSQLGAIYSKPAHGSHKPIKSIVVAVDFLHKILALLNRIYMKSNDLKPCFKCKKTAEVVGQT